MNEAEKYLAKNNLYDSCLNPDDEGNSWVYASEVMQKYTAEQLALYGVVEPFKGKKINRFEVIDKVGRAYVNYADRPLKIETSLQDDDRTLKVFLDD